MSQPNTSAEGAPKQPAGQDGIDIPKIQSLLKSKDDTQRFVGLALLKSVLDNSPQVREDEEAIQGLWSSLSSKFLDRLLKTGSKRSNENAKEMLDLVVSILHTFAVLLPAQALGKSKFVDRIPRLVSVVLYSSDDTTTLLLQLLHTLASSPEGAHALVEIDDLSPLTEIAPTHSIVLDIISFAWLNSMTAVDDAEAFTSQVDETIQSLASSFTSTDAVTFLEFLGSFLRQANPQILPLSPKWLPGVVHYIQQLVAKRPTAEARSAYTNAAASLLQIYPAQIPKLLFTDDKKSEKPFPYLLINLLLIDIRSSAPVLLEQLNTPQYPATSRRLTSAFDVICIFIGYLVQSLDDESLDNLIMAPDNLMKLRKTISETMSVTLEYLRDRWDATFAGAMGLHPDARAGVAETSHGSRRTLIWDSMDNKAENDPLVLSAIRASALWLREEENESLREEATGLIDMFMELYQGSAPEKLDFRSPVLVALEALVTIEQGREILLRQDGWSILSKDLASILQRSKDPSIVEDVSRGVEIVRVLLYIIEEDAADTPEDWMNLSTSVAAWDLPSHEQSPAVLEFQVAALQLSCALLAKASPGMRKRYTHTTNAISGIANQLSKHIRDDEFLREQMEDVTNTLDAISRA